MLSADNPFILKMKNAKALKKQFTVIEVIIGIIASCK